MATRFSIAYATRYGSTGEVAEAIGARLADLGHGVDVRKATQVRSLAWLRPVAAVMFVGKYDPARLRLADRLIALLPASPLHGIPARDDRDWGTIRAWAESLLEAMLPAGAKA